MRGLFKYRLFVWLTYPYTLFLKPQDKVKFYLKYMIKNPYALAYAYFQSWYESGNYTNTNSLQRKNPWSMAYHTKSPVWIKQGDNNGNPNSPIFAVYRSYADAVYDYVHRNYERFLDVKKVMFDDAPVASCNGNTDIICQAEASDYFAKVSYAMYISKWFIGDYSVYQKGVFAYYLSSCDSDGNLDVKYKRWRRSLWLIALGYLALISLIIYACMRRKRKKRKFKEKPK